jgi:RNA polymerase sigma factor (sigma-70 family)
MLRSDEQLIAATRRGEAEAFGELFGRHRALVLAYLVRRCSREDAADLLAETFAAALIAVHDGRAPRTGTVAPWLLTIARNKLVDTHRRGRVEDRLTRRLALERVEPDYQELEAVGMDVEAALSVLPSADRAALRARVLNEQPYEGIAREMDTTETAVRQRVSRALRRLRTDVEKQR